MLELTADRLVLVDDGTAQEFSGSLEDYTAFVLGRGNGNGEKGDNTATVKISRKDERRLAAEARERNQSLRKTVQEAERETARLTQRDRKSTRLNSSH